jgi:ActR/RegA family two-component response regulator
MDHATKLNAFARPTALVLDDQKSRRTALVRALGRRGLRVVEAVTPLQAIVCLQNGSRPIAIAVLAPTLATGTGSEFAAFMADEFPEVPYVISPGGDDVSDVARSIGRDISRALAPDVRAALGIALQPAIAT